MSAKKHPLRELHVGEVYVLPDAPRCFHNYAIGYRFSIRRSGTTVYVTRIS